jgi:hypothetical protein
MARVTDDEMGMKNTCTRDIFCLYMSIGYVVTQREKRRSTEMMRSDLLPI